PIHQFPVGRVRAPKGRAAKPGADELNRALEIVDKAREVRADRVAALREQIAKGTYSPDPLEVAREILKRGL
ncbi:MAG: flagellar biosynthesis anti-sigma factor FlgM, partial [Anaerolineaceae bacterium]